MMVKDLIKLFRVNDFPLPLSPIRAVESKISKDIFTNFFFRYV